MESQPKPESNVILTTGNTAVTLDGLTIQNYQKMERIRSRKEVRLEAQCLSWQLCRLLRRDFNLLAVKMFMRCTNADLRVQIGGLIQEVRLQAELLDADCRSYEPKPVPDIRTVPVRLISPESTSLYKAFMCADSAVARMNYAYGCGRLHSEHIEDSMRGFTDAFSDLKGFVIGTQSDKTAAELGIEQGIS